MSQESSTSKISKQVVVAAVTGATGGYMGGSLGGAVGGVLGTLSAMILEAPVARLHQEKIDGALAEIEEYFRSEIESVKSINENQFKILNEGISTVLRTVDSQKIEYLKRVIITAVNYSDYDNYESILLSRIIRDITSEEISFLVENFGYESVHVFSWYKQENRSNKEQEDFDKLKERIEQKNGLLVLPNTLEAFVVNGLVNLGVFAPGELSIGVHIYKYSGIAVKLIALLTSDIKKYNKAV